MPVKGMNLLLIKPFNFVHICLLAVGVGAIYLIWYKLRGKSEKTRERFLMGLCVANIALYFIYKAFLSVDAEFVQVSGLEKFNWFNELPLQLCNINLFLIPIGILTRRRGILGFAFFIAPLGAAMALTFPEIAFNGYSLLLPRMLGFYFTHLLLIVCGISLTTLGFYRPEYRDFPGIVAAFIVLSLGAHLVNTILRSTVCPQADYFFTYGADISVLNLLWSVIPIPYVYLLPALAVLLAYMGAITLGFNTVDRLRADSAVAAGNLRG